MRRYLAKYTINPALTHGVAHEVGSIQAGKLADIVLWRPAFFGAKPAMIIKGGMIVAAPMGDPNASIPTPQPVHYRPMFGALGRARTATSVSFVSKAALDNGMAERLKLDKRLVAVQGTRTVRKRDLVLNDYQPKIDVDSQTYEVRADGQLLICEPATVLPLAQRYFFLKLTSVLNITRKLPASTTPAHVQLVLPFQLRNKSRLRTTLDTGEEVD